MVIVIDNYDSFTFNIVHYLQMLGADVRVVMNNDANIKQLSAMNASHLIFSPGPGGPRDAGISMEAIRYFKGRVPILGVCLGHQCIAQVMGAQVVSAQQVMHGKVSLIEHRGEGILAGIPTPFSAMRYHSLVISPETLPRDIVVTAWTQGDENPTVMAMEHKKYPMFGVQFHPESVLSEHGHTLLKNFIAQ